jgi:hypothetical protein
MNILSLGAGVQSSEEKGQQNWLNECEGMCGV